MLLVLKSEYKIVVAVIVESPLSILFALLAYQHEIITAINHWFRNRKKIKNFCLVLDIRGPKLVEADVLQSRVL